MSDPVQFPPPVRMTRNDGDARLRAASVELEATFLAEMLKSAGLGAASSEFGGGAGETQFSSFLVEEQARQMARAGGIGLAEALFNAMKDHAHDE